MQITGYLKTSLIEWPGKISSVVFTLGCNFRCPFCHNADLIDSAKFNKKMLLDKREVLDNLEKRKNWTDAVVITGGEPTLQRDLPDFLKKVRNLGFLRMIQTNGTRPEIVNGLIIKGLTDYIAMDIKGDLENYSNYTNYSNDQMVKQIEETMRFIINSEVGYEFRTTVVPGLHNLKNLTKLARQIKTMLDTKYKIQNTKWFLQQFRPINTLDKKFLEIKPFSESELETFQKELQKIIPHTFLRGV